MALGAALKDRARAVRKLDTTHKVEGTTVMATETTAWFKCRLDLLGGQKGASASGRNFGRGEGNAERVQFTPSIMFGVKDSEGNSLIDDDTKECVVRAKDRVEVDSPELGHVMWEVTGNPLPMRKKKRVIGFTASLSRLDFQEFERRNP